MGEPEVGRQPKNRPFSGVKVGERDSGPSEASVTVLVGKPYPAVTDALAGL